MYLGQHLKDVWLAAGKLLDATAKDQLLALGLDPAKYLDRLGMCVRLAAAVHDLGKANDHFQGMICGTRGKNLSQGLRHEWVSLLILERLKERLLPALDGNATDFAIVEWAVAGHHPAHHHASPPKSCPAGIGATEIALRCSHPEFQAAAHWLALAFGLGEEPLVVSIDKLNLVGSVNVFLEINAWSRSAAKQWNEMRREDRRFVAAVKNSLIAADVAGSALPEEDPDNEDRWRWITQSLGEKPSSGDLQKIADQRLGGFRPRQFQDQVADSKDCVTLVKAGCGSGKTVAAYLWAARQHATRHLYFCYPTTGTATEGYKDYLWLPLEEKDNDTPLAQEVRDLGAKLFHSRREVDFEIILGAGQDAKDDDEAIRIESLDAWATPIVACTVDTVLGLVQNNRRGLYSWPAFVQSAFVFDEIHAYDDRLFGALLRFLRDLPGLPVLLMTASLPAPREEALRHLVEQRPDTIWKPIGGPKGLEECGRYCKETVANNDPLPAIKRELKAGGKVLWVCNTVKRVMNAADAATGCDPKIYHSRFKYEHRVERHKDVIRAFTQEHKGAALAVCSQVAEMSLDLKGCTMLVTDEATVPAVIQRLGRLNRQAKPKEKDGDPDPLTMPFVMVVPEDNLPYTAEDLLAVRKWHDRLKPDGISQKDLADAWEQDANNPPDLVPSAWLDGGPITSVHELREGSPGITIILKSDADPILAYKARVAAALQKAREEKKRPPKSTWDVLPGECKPKRMNRFTLPMTPPRKNIPWQSWRKLNGVPICPDHFVTYSAQRGAEWRTE